MAALALGVGLWNSKASPSPLEGVVPPGAPLAVEGRVGAVLDLLHRTRPAGPKVLKEFGLTGALAANPDGRMLVALLPGAPGSDAEAGEACRRSLATLAAEMDSAWERSEAYPASLADAPPCPAGGKRTLSLDGSDFVAECQGGDHHLRYRSRDGFVDAPDGPSPRPAEPPVLVAMDGTLPAPRPVRAELASRGSRGIRVLSSDRRVLEVPPDAPPAAAAGLLPGPAEAPVRIRMDSPAAAHWLPPTLSALLRGTRGVQIWGDPARGRWSIRAEDPSGGPAVSADVAGALGELPPSAVALAATPEFLGHLWPAAAEALAADHRCRPGVLALASSEPLRDEEWGPGLARLLAGRSPAVLRASCADASQAREWLSATSLGTSLSWTGNRVRVPGVEADLEGGSLTLRLAGDGWIAPPRPKIPSSRSEAMAAGWLTVREPEGSRAVYAWSAGWSDGQRWLEVARTAAPAAPESEAAAEIPLIKSR